jgi:hypothetical protein
MRSFYILVQITHKNCTCSLSLCLVYLLPLWCTSNPVEISHDQDFVYAETWTCVHIWVHHAEAIAAMFFLWTFLCQCWFVKRTYFKHICGYELSLHHAGEMVRSWGNFLFQCQSKKSPLSGDWAVYSRLMPVFLSWLVTFSSVSRSLSFIQPRNFFSSRGTFLLLLCMIVSRCFTLSYSAATSTLIVGLQGWVAKLEFNTYYTGSRDSSVGIATGYRLDDQGEREFESR